jgi:hypothetical protein
MYDLFMNKGGDNEEDGAMFTTKPIQGSCASCAKNVINLYGKKSDYLPWGKLPFRDPSERIARVGQGFSKMLSMINPDQLSQMNAFNGQGQSNEMMTGYDQNMTNTATHKNLLNRGMGSNIKTQANFNS